MKAKDIIDSVLNEHTNSKYKVFVMLEEGEIIYLTDVGSGYRGPSEITLDQALSKLNPNGWYLVFEQFQHSGGLPVPSTASAIFIVHSDVVIPEFGPNEVFSDHPETVPVFNAINAKLASMSWDQTPGGPDETYGRIKRVSPDVIRYMVENFKHVPTDKVGGISAAMQKCRRILDTALGSGTRAPEKDEEFIAKAPDQIVQLNNHDNQVLFKYRKTYMTAFPRCGVEWATNGWIDWTDIEGNLDA